MYVMYPVIAFLVGFILVYVSVPTIINVARSKRLFDEPNERTASQERVPTLGGVAIFIGLLISTIIGTFNFAFVEFKYLTVAVILMFFIGLKDDIQAISARRKLYVQILAAVILVVLGDFRFTNLHGFFWVHEINYTVSFLISCFMIIAIINAFNLIDGIDGLASGVSIVVASAFGAWFLLSGHPEYGIMCVGLVGTLVAFFMYNVFGKTNKIFMGDTGSLILGVTMSIVVIKFNEFNIVAGQPYSVASAPAVSFGIMIVPIIDTLRVFVIRLLQKRSPFSPDMNHIHHRLLKLGNNHIQSTSIIVGTNIGFILLSFWLSYFFGTNSLFVILFILGLAIGNLPSFILKYKREEPIPSLVPSSPKDEKKSKNVEFHHHAAKNAEPLSISFRKSKKIRARGSEKIKA